MPLAGSGQMPRHQNSFACGLDAPELTVDKRVRRARAAGGTKVQKHPGKVSIKPAARVHDDWCSDEEEEWSEQNASVETTATIATETGTAVEEDLDNWDVVSQTKPKEDEWPSLQQSCDPDLLKYDLFETMSQVSDMTLGSWVDVEDLHSPSRATRPVEQTWASRIGPNNGLPKPKTALPWAGKLRPTPEDKPCHSSGSDDLAPEAQRTWTKWQKSSRSIKAVERRLLETERRQQQRRGSVF